MKNFNLVAPIYDPVKRLIFGSVPDQAAACFLDRIQPEDRVLILGGGAGEILKSIKSEKITYVDNSEKMVRKARSQNPNVTFVIRSFEDFHSPKKFDWTICPYFLDVFPESKLPEMVEKIKSLLGENGHLIVTDFQVTRRSQRLLIVIMYTFFVVTTQIRHFSIPPIDQRLLQSGFYEQESEFFLNAFIFSRIYTLGGNPRRK